MGIFSSLLRGISYLLFFLSVWFLWPREMDASGLTSEGGVVPDYAMSNARYVSVQGGRVEIESQSSDAEYLLAERQILARGVKAKFFDSSGRATDVTSKRATFWLDHRRVQLQDDVTSVSPDGFQLRAPEANYFLDRRFLTAGPSVAGEASDHAVKVWGDKAESLIDDRKAYFIGNARTEFKDKRRGITRIRGDKATVDRQQQEVIFDKNVKVNQDRVEGTSNRANLKYSTEDKAVSYMSMLEDVEMKETGGRHTRSQVAEFFAPTDTIVLTGFPAVYHGDDAVTGDRITLYRATGVVEVTQTNAAGNASRSSKLKPAPLTKEDEELIP